MRALTILAILSCPLITWADGPPTRAAANRATRDTAKPPYRAIGGDNGDHQLCGPNMNAQCPDNMYCKLPVGACDSDVQGVCRPVPICTQDYHPVCGCDGNTYANACEASAAGTSIDHFGPCLETGVCCLDVTDGPIPHETCEMTTPEECAEGGGVFANVDSTCDNVQACCLEFADATLCALLPPSCCEASGGVPLGPGSTCNNTDPDGTPGDCPQTCGGIQGIPCDDPDQFCKLPPGQCCCDHTGVCTDIPQGCPDVWDPVCGCDGVTYGNECEADAAGVSIDHDGECNTICLPADDGQGCQQVNCSDIPEEICLQALIHLDIETGALTTLACACLDLNACHIEFGNASPFAVGECPNNQECQVIASDSNNDGIDDTFGAACVVVVNGVCCLDITDGPIQWETCEQATAAECEDLGGVFWNENSSCAQIEACCLQTPNLGVCADIARGCCVLSGGLPQGPGSSCSNTDPDGTTGCPEVCGGILGIPCSDPAEFCKLPTGQCCCDFQGVCTPIPEACPEYLDPVCGCDGVTYDNPCFADAAGVSIDFEGPCDPPGVCCHDISDGPVQWETCEDSTQSACEETGGVFWNAGSSCAQVEACCLTFAGASFCTEIARGCCLVSGGTPQGPNSACGDANPDGTPTCSDVCGGVLGIPCDDPDQFCKLPIGHCCCDFFGTCTDMPNGCFDVWDPVCGCDDVTYGNECEADAAGVSIKHLGECEAICQPDLNGVGCSPDACSAIPEDRCQPQVIHLDVNTGALSTLACDCVDFNSCHIDFGDASPIGVGNCPDGQTCTVTGTDSDNDGLLDTFSAACAPLAGPVCCLDISDGPIPWETCTMLPPDACEAEGGLSWNQNGSCGQIEPCCFPDQNLCIELARGCCELSGGTPLGPNGTCAPGTTLCP